VIPGAGGYTPMWRVNIVRTTSSYRGEQIRSSDAIDLGVQMGILEVPEPETKVVNCPVVHRDAAVELSATATAAPTWAWYRNRKVSWFEFSDVVERPIEDTELETQPVYIFQRSNEAFPIYEFATGIDEDGDFQFHSSNNVFAAKDAADPDYSPLWFVSIVRTPPDYPSIDTPGQAVGITHADQVRTSTTVLVADDRARVVNCPLQRTMGEL